MNVEEEMPWLTAMIDQRVAFMVEKGALDIAREAGTNFVMSLLDEGREDMPAEEIERWERTCDHCGKYVPPEPERPNYTEFYSGYVTRVVEGVQIMLAFGVCGTCKEDHTMKGTDE
jgi:hypothetical protein